MKTMKEILHTADGIGDKPMAVADELYQGDEVHELLDLIQDDWSIHDLDQYEAEHMQSTLGSVLCGLMKRYQVMMEAREQLCNNCGIMCDRMMKEDLT